MLVEGYSEKLVELEARIKVNENSNIQKPAIPSYAQEWDQILKELETDKIGEYALLKKRVEIERIYYENFLKKMSAELVKHDLIISESRLAVKFATEQFKDEKITEKELEEAYDRVTLAYEQAAQTTKVVLEACKVVTEELEYLKGLKYKCKIFTRLF